MAALAESMEDWLSKYVDVSSGTPSAYTLERVISLIEPTHLEKALHEIGELLREEVPDEVIAIDGKSLRGTRQISQRPLHLLHARGCTNRVCLGQIQVDEKSNEITAISEMLDRLYLKGSIMRADALNTQKAVAAKVIEKGANYVLPVKENHPNFLESLKLLYKDAEERGYVGIDADHFESLEKSRGRVEERSCVALDASDLVEVKEWKGLKTADKIVRKRTVKDKTTEEIIYYISSLELDASKIGKAAREHWSIENHLHYGLEVVLDEDRHQYRDRNGASNLSVLRKIVLAALEKTETKKKRSKKPKDS